jgi:ribosomal protein S12 methylthiotransferase accessory factor
MSRMEDEDAGLADWLHAAAKALASAAERATNAGDSSLLRYLDYDDGNHALTEGRVRMLRAATLLRRLFLLPVPDAPGLVFFGGEIDPGVLGEQHAGLPIGNLAGSGLSPQRAFEACVGEGIEYLSQFVHSEDPHERGLLRDYVGADGHARRFISSILTSSEIDADRQIAWTRAHRLLDGTSAWFPLDLCYRRRASDQDFKPPLKLSSGCAAGATIEAATLRGLLELVERDAVALWWRGGRLGQAVGSETEAARAAMELLAKLRQDAGDRETWLLDITTDIDIPVIAAMSARADGFGFAVGFGARLDLAEAARAAIFELCQVEIGQHVVAAKRHESGDGALNESDRRQLRRSTLLDTRNCALLRPATPDATASEMLLPDSGLREIIKRLEERDVPIYAIDLSRARFDIPVVRVIAPALQLEPCDVVGPRLARAISTTGGGAIHHGGLHLL